MASVREWRDVFAYNGKVLRDFCDALAALPPEVAAKDRGATHGSLKNIFFHILTVHDGWLNVAAQGATAVPELRDLDDFDDIKTVAELRPFLEAILAKEEAFLNRLKPADLERPVQPPWKKRPHPLRDAFMQVTLEQAHHTGELIALLWQEDIEPPEMTWVDVRLALKGDPGPS